jgi:ribosomal protein S18 acetylase RimI-like enzyme
MPDISKVEKLTAEHVTKPFKCTEHVLNDWLKRYALKNQVADSGQTYVLHRANTVVAYYSLVYGEVALEECSPDVQRDMPPRFPVPIIKIARLAVDKREERQGLGRALMKDAFSRILGAAEIAGLRAIVVDALNDKAKNWYEEKFGFEASPIGPRTLFLRIQDLRLAAGAASFQSEEK